MHKFIITRGVSKYVRRWKENLEEVFMAHPLKNKDGKVTSNGQVQLVMRPFELWELVYPEQHDDTICKLIGDEGYGHQGALKKGMRFIAKLLGLEKTEGKADLTNIIPQAPRPHVAVHVLGNKKDKRDANGNEMI